MLLLKPRMWQITVGYASSPDIHRVLPAVFASMAQSTASESTAIGLPELAWSSRILQPERNFFNHLLIAPPLLAQHFFGGFRGAMAQFEPIKHKFLNHSTLHVNQHSFQITHRRKQCRTCQCTNYNDTINHRGYFFHDLNGFGRLIRAPQTSTCQNVEKTFDSPRT